MLLEENHWTLLSQNQETNVLNDIQGQTLLSIVLLIKTSDSKKNREASQIP